MPVTARLSKAFYDRFGEQVTNELVDWFNDVDETYRNGLRELNELNFARFDAKLEQRFAQQDAKWERRFAEFEVKFEKRLAELDAKWERRFAELDAKIAASESRLLRWMFVFWTGNLVATAGMLFAVVRFRG